jgi:exopolysaccharide biosynthesis polyprenyl glycosylphosphotransferase
MEVLEASVAELTGAIDRPLVAGAPTMQVADATLDGRGVAGPAAGHDPVLLARRRARRRLGAGLVLWDALSPIPVVGAMSRLTGSGGVEIGNPAGRLAVLLALLSPIAVAVAGGYDHTQRRAGRRAMFVLRLLLAGVILSWAGAISYGAVGWTIRPIQMVGVALLLPATWLLGRWAYDRHPAVATQRALLVGAGVQAERLVQLTRRHPESRIEIVGRVGDADTMKTAGDQGPPLLGSLAELPDLVARDGIDLVLVAFVPGRDSQLVGALRAVAGHGVAVDVVPRFYDLLGPTPSANAVGALGLLRVPGLGLSAGKRFQKRALDITGAGLLLALTAPILAMVAVAVSVADGRPVIFRQTRVGRRGVPFEILKFRTMRQAADDAEPHAAVEDIAAAVDQIKTSGADRTTRVGALLRRTSLDELPQLVNVLKGDMSLVGPRPLRPFEVAALEPWQRVRQDLRPGLTGLWQVLGRSDIGWEERMQLDYIYVAHWSLLEDLRILARTGPAVLGKDGAV